MSEQSEKLPPHEYQRFLQNLPTDWDRKEIRRLGTVFGGGTPSRDVPSFWRGSIPWVTPGELSGNTTKCLHDTNEHISASGLAGSGANLLPVGSLMVTTRATLGARAINAVPMATNQGFKSIVFKDTADAEFYFHLFDKVQPELMRRASGTTFLEISAAEFSCIEVPSPKSSEKCLIAKVLDTLDIAIHEAEAIIAKLKAVKQGLLHDLLTRGIDANGELRPPQAEAPHLYKQSPLGWIPREWDAGTIGSYLDGEQGIKPGPFGSSIKKEAYSESGFKVYGQEQVIAGDQEIGSYFVPLRKFQELQDFAVEVGDVLISLVGTIGKVLVLKEALELGIINPRLMRLRPDSRIAHPDFVGLLVSSNAFVSQVVANAGGGTMPVINKRIISSIRVPVVPLNEQQDMLKRKNATDQRISCECSALEKLRALKFGVMDDLLTGRVRVTPLLQERQQA